MPLPDFLIVGAMKCGTSTLAAQLAAQPGVFMTTPKEPNFFSNDEVFARGLPWYESLFDGAKPDDLKGEASTHYTKLPTYPETLARMRAVIGMPRIIYMIRDPIERAVSHYIHEWTEGRTGSDPVAAFERHAELVDYGRYAMQITPFVDQYGCDRICLTSLERLKAEPAAELDRIGIFLGLKSRPIWQEDLGRQNVSAERFRPLPFQRLLVDNPIAATLRRGLIPKTWRERIRKSRTIGQRPQLPENLHRRLEEVFAEDHARLSELFPGHPALTDAYPSFVAA